MANTCRFSKIINAPLRFTYEWCTDFTENDHKISGSKLQRLIVEKTKRRAVYVNQPKGTKTGTNVGIVTLQPPDRWFVNTIGNPNIECGKYRLKKLSPNTTQLEITFKLKPKLRSTSDRTQYLKRLNQTWSKYTAALERDYESKN